MWWKLTVLVLVTSGLIFCVIPVRTHAVLFDPANPRHVPRWTLSSTISNMHLTTGTAASICAIMVVAAYVAFRVVRSA